METVKKSLIELSDSEYRSFQVLGVRMPVLRLFAKSINGSETEKIFLSELPHEYYDEDNLHGILISLEKDISEVFRLLDEFLPYVDNWATCDMISPKIFSANKKELLIKINEWINSKDTYTVRFAVVMLLKHFLDDDFSPLQMQSVAETESDAYYVNMARAWYFATALAKQYSTAIEYLEKGALDELTHNATVRKALESYMIPDDKKKYIRSLKI